MKKYFFASFLIIAFTLCAHGAKYKVNTSGKVTSPQGTVQTKSILSNPYNNYNAQNYVAQKQVLREPVGTIDIVMDYSGSMLYWINEAKNSMNSIVSQLPVNTKTGFRVFGHNGGNNPYTPVLAKVKSVTKSSDGKYKVSAKHASYLGNTSGGCSATTQVAKLAQNNANALINGMNSVKIGGATPLTLGLSQAVEYDFINLPTSYKKKIVLITDGGESCGGDPCAFAQDLIKKRSDIVIDVVLVSTSSRALRCVSDVTGGKLYTPADVQSFNNDIMDSMSNGTQTFTEKDNNEQGQKYEFID